MIAAQLDHIAAGPLINMRGFGRAYRAKNRLAIAEIPCQFLRVVQPRSHGHSQGCRLVDPDFRDMGEQGDAARDSSAFIDSEIHSHPRHEPAEVYALSAGEEAHPDIAQATQVAVRRQHLAWYLPQHSSGSAEVVERIRENLPR